MEGGQESEEDQNEEVEDEPEENGEGEEEEEVEGGNQEEEKRLTNIATFMYRINNITLSNLLEEHRTKCVNNQNFKGLNLHISVSKN